MFKKLKRCFLILLLLIANQLTAQIFPTKQDSLRGSITPERVWWDVLKYNLTVEPDYTTKTISGFNEIYFRVVRESGKMQIDLQEPMQIDSIVIYSQKLNFSREGNVYYVDFSKVTLSEFESIKVFYSGKPREAVKPPWDGGWIWKKDAKGREWISVACQGLGASVWYPCKDHQSDEPDLGALISIVTKKELTAVSNGTLRSVIEQKDKKITTWEVVNPINNYNLVPYIGYYVSREEIYKGEKGDLKCQYWVLDYELEKSKRQFSQAAKMLTCFESWFGPYPFYQDGYKIVQAPHLGMEHQSAIAYGNGFKNGYLGTDLSRSGWGLKWDFILIHESGHEWFGNNITTKDIADMWVHESFTNYSETIFTQFLYGKKAGEEYVQGTRKLIRNDIPIIGKYDVNQEGSGDMYYKGANMLHMIRQIMDNDEEFKNMLRALNKEFYHQTVTTHQVEAFINKYAALSFNLIFDQYLRTNQVPVLEYYVEEKQVHYRWTNCVKKFNMPVKVNGEWIYPTEEWQELSPKYLKRKKLEIDPNFYIIVHKSKKKN